MSIMFLYVHSSISLSTFGSAYVDAKVARLSRSLPCKQRILSTNATLKSARVDAQVARFERAFACMQRLCVSAVLI